MSSSRTETGLVDVTMPQMGVSVAEGTIVEWKRQVGDEIAADETICEITTDKIDTEVPAPVSGIVAEILVEVEETVTVGTVLARIAVAGGGEPADAPSGAAPEAVSEVGATDAAAALDPPSDTAAPKPAAAANGDGARAPRGRFSPVVQRIAAQHDVDLAQVTGTGRGGRVRKQDVLAHIEQRDAGPEPPLHIESPYRPDPVPAGGGLSRMRRQIGEHMKRSLETAATCTTWTEADVTRVERARRKLGLTALPVIARCTIDALREFPALNATLDGDAYAQYPDVNLGIAVSVGDDGLIVPVIHRAQELSPEGLGARIKDLARRARAKELTPDDVRGGTFTITNPGQFGSIMATPVINQPQVGILDLEAVVKRPVVVTDADGNDSIAIRSMTILGLSWDHRALDGVLAAQFLGELKRRLESYGY